VEESWLSIKRRELNFNKGLQLQFDGGKGALNATALKHRTRRFIAATLSVGRGALSANWIEFYFHEVKR
jgi:hypothetical protein